MAIRKMRSENEDLTSKWDALQKLTKLQALQKKNEQHKNTMSRVHKRKRHSIKLT